MTFRNIISPYNNAPHSFHLHIHCPSRQLLFAGNTEVPFCLFLGETTQLEISEYCPELSKLDGESVYLMCVL